MALEPELAQLLSWTTAIAALGGAVMRMLFGLWKAYNDRRYVSFDWKRISLEILASIGFGLFALLGLRVVKVADFAPSLNIVLIALSGFGGADLLNILGKRIGIANIQTVFQRMIPGLNDRQMKALDYLAIHGSITNDQYQELTGAGNTTAVRDFNVLVKKGIVKRTGIGRAIAYRF